MVPGRLQTRPIEPLTECSTNKITERSKFGSPICGMATSNPGASASTAASMACAERPRKRERLFPEGRKPRAHAGGPLAVERREVVLRDLVRHRAWAVE